MNNLDIEFLENLKYKWTADVILKNGVKNTIWYTALPMRKPTIEKVLSVSSDYPRSEIKPLW